MKFYKRLSLDNENPRDSKLAIELDGRIVTDTTRSLQIPAGAYYQRPTTDLVNGMIRYSTDMNQFEAYIDGQWETLKTNRQQNIVKQVFTNTNYANTMFGPLEYNVDPTKPQNVIVLVENVFQVADANYTLEVSSDATPWTTSTTVVQEAFPGDTVLYLSSAADFQTGLFLSGDSVSGCVIVDYDVITDAIEVSPGITGYIPVGTPISVIYNSGTYVHFTSDSVPVPEKPVTVMLGFDGYTPPFTPPI